MGTTVETVYEPIKIGIEQDRIFVEVHPDVYHRIPDYEQYAEEILNTSPMRERIDTERYLAAVRLKNGLPLDVTRKNKNPPVSVNGTFASVNSK